MKSQSSSSAFRAGVSKAGTDDNGLSAFLSIRPRLLGIARRVLRSATEAEDIVQDVWVRWQTADRVLVRDAAAFLATTTRRLAINVVQSARSRRETWSQPSLPEPVETGIDALLQAQRGQALAYGVLQLLEKLTPTERAAYILREAFDYSYREIASAIRLEEAYARQLVTRARRHVTNDRRTSANSADQQRLLDALGAATEHGYVADVERMLCGGCRRMSKRQRVPSRRPDLADRMAVTRQCDAA